MYFEDLLLLGATQINTEVGGEQCGQCRNHYRACGYLEEIVHSGSELVCLAFVCPHMNTMGILKRQQSGGKYDSQNNDADPSQFSLGHMRLLSKKWVS